MRKARNLSIETLLHKSKEELVDSDVALANGRFNNSVNRSYYSMFHAATAALKTQISEFEPNKHKDVLGQFNRHIVFKCGFSKEAGQNLRELEGARMVADYEGIDFEQADAQEFNKYAHDFNVEINKFIESTKSLVKNSSFDINKISSPGIETGDISDFVTDKNLKASRDDDPQP